MEYTFVIFRNVRKERTVSSSESNWLYRRKIVMEKTVDINPTIRNREH